MKRTRKNAPINTFANANESRVNLRLTQAEAELCKGIIDEALKKQLSNSNDINAPFIDIEDYKKKTGKRFRMTKAQRESGLTREQAFQEFMENMVEKG